MINYTFRSIIELNSKNKKYVKLFQFSYDQSQLKHELIRSLVAISPQAWSKTKTQYQLTLTNSQLESTDTIPCDDAFLQSEDGKMTLGQYFSLLSLWAPCPVSMCP